MTRAIAVGTSLAVGLALSACATGQSSSFATRVNSGGSFEAAQDEETRANRADFENRPDLLASSGNVLLPGAYRFPAAGGQLLAAIDPMSGPTASLPPLANQGTALTALLNGGVDVTLTGPNGPGATVDLNGAINGAGGNPALASLAPVTSTLAPATSTLSPVASAVQGAGPLASANGQGVSLAGQPLASLGGASPILSSAGSIAGGATAAAAPITSAVTPAVTGAVSAAGQAVGAAPPPTPGAPAQQPVAGLGGLGGLLPNRR